jgi:hypothetical protein
VAELTRRTVLAGLGVSALSATGLATFETASSEAGLVRSNMRQPDFEAFVLDLDTYRGSAGSLKMAAYRMLSSDETQWASGLVSERIGEGYERYERKVLTNFLVKTDYLRLADPEAEFASMIGDGPCQSPFARFDMAGGAA